MPFKQSKYTRAVRGRELYNLFGNRVVESRNTAGNLVAVKVKPQEGFVRSEADMMHFASQKPGILAPHVLGCYDVDPGIIATVTNFILGDSFDKVWHTLDSQQCDSIKLQLKEQLQLYRTHTRSYIGRRYHQETNNFFDCLHFNFMEPFESEEEFDEWYLARVKPPLSKAILKLLLPKMRAKGPPNLFSQTGTCLPGISWFTREGSQVLLTGSTGGSFLSTWSTP